MIGEILCQIKVSEFVVHFCFESEGCVAGYGRILFLDSAGTLISTFDPDGSEPLLIPHRLFLGKSVTGFLVKPGVLRMEFELSGSVEIRRVADEIEIGLITLRDHIEVLT